MLIKLRVVLLMMMTSIVNDGEYYHVLADNGDDDDGDNSLTTTSMKTLITMMKGGIQEFLFFRLQYFKCPTTYIPQFITALIISLSVYRQSWNRWCTCGNMSSLTPAMVLSDPEINSNKKPVK